MEINRMIDHTILKADAQAADVMKIIEEAKKYRFYSVCINPTWVALAAKELQGEPVAVCTVIGFPLGANTTETKAFEAANAIANGADEVDMVINIAELKDGNDEKVQKDIEAVVAAAKDKALVKASGGLKDKDTFLKMIEAGASRIGASKGVEIIKELKK